MLPAIRCVFFQHLALLWRSGPRLFAEPGDVCRAGNVLKIDLF